MHKVILFNNSIPDAIRHFIKRNNCENPRFDENLIAFIESHEIVSEDEFNSARTHLHMIEYPDTLIGVNMQDGFKRYYGYRESKGEFCYVRIGEYTYNSYKRPVLITSNGYDELTTLDKLYVINEETKLYALSTESKNDIGEEENE